MTSFPWHLPGPARYLDSVGESLEQGHHVCLILPTYVRRHFDWKLLRRILRSRELGELQVVGAPGDVADPVSVLREALGARHLHDAEDFCRDEELPSRFIAVTVTSSPVQAAEAWSRFLEEVGVITRSDGSANQLILLLEPTDTRPKADVAVDLAPWWGVFGQADLELTVRGLLSSDVAESLWSESLIRGLLRTRLDLAATIEADPPDSVEAALEGLQQQMVGLDSKYSGGLRIDRPWTLRPNPQPAPDWRSDAAAAWGEGLLDWHHLDGSVLLSIVADGTVPPLVFVTAAVARGQREVLFPVVERVREAVQAWACERFGSRWDAMGDPETDPHDRAHDIGELVEALEYRSEFQPDECRRALAVTRQWRRVRNAIAHGAVVSMDRINDAVGAYQSFLGQEGLR